MTELDREFSATHNSRVLKLQKVDLKKLQSQHEELQSRVSQLKTLLLQNDSLIKSQRTSLKLHEEKITQLTLNNDTLKHIIKILSKHITETLNETLPILPPLPQEHLANIDSLLAASSRRDKKKSNRRLKSTSDIKEVSLSHVQSEKPQSKEKNYFEFAAADLLSAIADVQGVRRAAQQVAKNLGRYSIVTSHRISIFECLSFFLSLRNVAFMHNFEVFLPRVLEMICDFLDLERVALYVYEDDQLYAMAATGDNAKQMLIPKGFSHLFLALEQPIVIANTYDDPRFDVRYDQMGGFKTNNVACFPVKIGEELVGVLECANKKNEFLKEDVVMLSLACRQIALGTAGKRFQDMVKDNDRENDKEKQGDEEKMIYPVLKTLALSIKQFVLCEKVSVYQFNSEKNELRCIVSTDTLARFKVSLNYSFPGLCFSSKKPLIIANAEENSMHNPDIDRKLGVTPTELLLIPLANIGVIECINKSKGFSSRDELKVASLGTVAKGLLDCISSFENKLETSQINQQFCDHVDKGLICVDYKGVVKEINRLAVQLMHKEKENVIGRMMNEALEDADSLISVVMKNKGLENVSIDGVNVAGSIFNVEISYFPKYCMLALTTSG